MKIEVRNAELHEAAGRRGPPPIRCVIPPPRRGATATELLVVLMLLGILGTMSFTVFTTERKHNDTDSAASKIAALFGAARAHAISSEELHYQVTFWQTTPSYWIDEIEPSDPRDFVNVPAVVRSKIVTPEKLNNQIVITNFIGGIRNPVLNTVSFRFFPDGTSDEGTVFLLRREADPLGSNYFKVKLYGPTAKAGVFENVANP